jgi:hypothetical protein
VPRSRMKLPSSRGEDWPEAICRATMVRANTSPVTVIMVVETTIRTLRASPALPWKAGGEWSPIATRDSSAPAARNTRTEMVGRTQRAPARSSHSTRRRTSSFIPGASAAEQALCLPTVHLSARRRK